MMGYDAWSDGLSADDYLEQCLSSPKYSQGTWYVLEDGGGLVSTNGYTEPFKAFSYADTE